MRSPGTTMRRCSPSARLRNAAMSGLAASARFRPSMRAPSAASNGMILGISISILPRLSTISLADSPYQRANSSLCGLHQLGDGGADGLGVAVAAQVLRARAALDQRGGDRPLDGFGRLRI